ncbi:alpha/beta fold hydrolase [Actinosynnema sp. NPDC020468]|uniref:alpha/beta fold hydrolase n=1 Tax=Actinosynnema sp. NPDC020468 TaxID=3154488 RepID=UPI0033CBFD32
MTVVALPTGVSVSWNVDGAGPWLALWGGPHTCEVVRSFLGPPLVAAGFRVLTSEYRGLPPSDVPAPPYSVAQLAGDAAALLDVVGTGPCRVFGYSLGAFVAQELAGARPDLVSALALAGTRLEPGAVYRHLHAEALARLESGGAIPEATMALLRVSVMFAPRRLASDAFAAHALEMMGRPPVEGYSELGLTQASAHYRPDPAVLAGIRAPALVVGFEDDVLTPPAQGRAVAGTIPRARYAQIRRAGHGAFMEKPGELVRLVTRFFAEVA